MKHARSLVRVLVIASIVSALALPSTAGAAVSYGTQRVTADISIGGIPLQGMGEPAARATILQASVLPTMPPVVVAAGATVFQFAPAAGLVPDIDGMLAQAFEPTDTVGLTIEPRFVVSSSAVNGWVGSMGTTLNRPAINAKRSIRSRRLYISPEIAGRKVDATTGKAALRTALLARLDAPASEQPTVTVPLLTVAPRVTRRNIGKTILVSQREFKVLLYNGTRVEKTYRCAVGMSRYPTPNGIFKIIGKNPHPGWTNPGSDWGTNMPGYIGPGPSNPLGLRALYLNSPGIRIHGTAKYSSIGTRASHGCIRLANPQVVDIYPRVPIGTPVYIFSR